MRVLSVTLQYLIVHLLFFGCLQFLVKGLRVGFKITVTLTTTSVFVAPSQIVAIDQLL